MFAAAQDMPLEALSNFLVQWRRQLCNELRTNASGVMGRKCPKLATDIPSDFPSIDHVMAFVKPLTSYSSGCSFHAPSLALKEPDICHLASICAQNFSWGDADSLLTKFCKILWDGICLKMLCMVRIKQSCPIPYFNVDGRAHFPDKFGSLVLKGNSPRFQLCESEMSSFSVASSRPTVLTSTPNF